MRTNPGTVAGMAALAMVLGAGSPAVALDDAAALRCAATGAGNAARLFGCAARCQERTERFWQAGLVSDPSRCHDRCDQRYQHGLRNPRCEASAGRVLAADLVGVDAATLRCREALSEIEEGLLGCLAKCADHAKRAARRGLAFDAESCVDACADADAAAVARAEARGGCADGEAVP